MKHIRKFNRFNEGRATNIIAGLTLFGLSLLGVYKIDIRDCNLYNSQKMPIDINIYNNKQIIGKVATIKSTYKGRTECLIKDENGNYIEVVIYANTKNGKKTLHIFSNYDLVKVGDSVKINFNHGGDILNLYRKHVDGEWDEGYATTNLVLK